MISAVIYAAKSTEDTKGSISDQIKGCRQLATERAWEVDGEYQDEAKSAFHGSRGDGLAAAMEHCERLKADAGAIEAVWLLVEHSSRLARGDGQKARHLVDFQKWSRTTGVKILSIDDPGAFPEISSGFDMTMTAMAGDLNNAESKRKGEAVKRGQRRRVTDRGRYRGGRRPFGYRYGHRLDSSGKKESWLVVDPVEAPVVLRIFAEFIGGAAQNAIAKSLRAERVPTLTATDVAEGRHKPGPRASTASEWHATTIKGILTNPIYAGMLTLNGEHFPGTHEAIIDQGTWQRACDLRAARHAQGGGGHKKAGRWAAGRHLLADGLLRCTCGAVMSPRTVKDHRGSDYVYEVYVCARKLHHGAGACPHSQQPIKRAVVDEAVYSFFERVALDQGSARKAFGEQVERELAGLSVLERQAENELVGADAALARIEGDYISGRITAEKWERLETRVVAERGAASAQLEQHQRRRQEIEQAASEIDVADAVADELENLRRMITSQVRESDSGGAAALRATLKRLFAGFELAGPRAPFGSGAVRGEVWQSWEDDGSLTLGDGSYLLAFVRPQAVRASHDEGVGVPAIQREGLAALSDNLYSFLPAW